MKMDLEKALVLLKNILNKMKKIYIIFRHHNSKNAFNAAIRDTFIDEAKKCGHQIDLINLKN